MSVSGCRLKGRKRRRGGVARWREGNEGWEGDIKLGITFYTV